MPSRSRLVETSLQIAGLRIDCGKWLVCDLIRGKGGTVVCRDLQGDLQSGRFSEFSLLAAATADQQSDFFVSSDHASVNWPRLKLRISVEAMLQGSPHSIPHCWNAARLRTEISEQELMNCWLESRSLRVIDLAAAGACAVRSQQKGGQADPNSQFEWNVTGSRRFVLFETLNQPPTFSPAAQTALSEAMGNFNPACWVNTYEIVRYDGKVIELLMTRTGVFQFGPVPVWWQRWRRPKAWSAER
ncbi:MAG TPA: hypothetical protein VL132_12710, partial [Planctomycetaceae bacterium]|nr:hypothetical protein [Planctomycetaceae bacterium]